MDDNICTTRVDDWIEEQKFNSTEDVEIPAKMTDQVIGQEDAVYVIKKAAEQRRHVMLIGEPGTGKSMLAHSMIEYLPQNEHEDIISYANHEDPNEPIIKVVPAGKGKEIVSAQKAEAAQKMEQKAQAMMTIVFLIVGFSVVMFVLDGMNSGEYNPMWIFFGILAAVFIYMASRWPGSRQEQAAIPKLLLSRVADEPAPFIDATGAHAGALLGDVKHDPFQSGGLETPAHDRVEIGAIHKANKGVLFLDEINMLKMESQQSLLTALQEKAFSIVGQSERSSGAMVKSQPVPCDFILVAAGNLDSIYGIRDENGVLRGGMHPALRSRIRGYGYETYMRNTMPDTDENRKKLIRFVAQEVTKDKKIPHFTKKAVAEIIREAQRRTGRRGQLTLRLRELGGLVRVAGDIAKGKKLPYATHVEVVEGKKVARSLEQQIVERMIEHSMDYPTHSIEGGAIGLVNGLAVMAGDASMSEYSGIVLPIAAEVTPAQAKSNGRIIATGKLGEMAKESVQNVSALFKKLTGEDISNHDVHVQFIGSRDGTEGDSASISVATAVFSALEGIEVNQSVAMTGSLSVRGKVLPVGGVTAKIEAAAEMGLKKVIIPKSNLKDVILEDRYTNMIEIIPVENISEVLEHALIIGPEKDGLLKRLTSVIVPKRVTGAANLDSTPA
ncbi:MAG: ATP-dependent protease LonB [Thermoplasmata archaeon]|nr:ATP-dependent protease LonB [Thermoplasmata archaeon]